MNKMQNRIYETRGRKKLPADERREVAFVVRLSDKEWNTLNKNWKDSGIRFRTQFARERLLGGEHNATK